MEEIVLSSDSSNPPSPVLKEMNCHSNFSPIKNSVCEQLSPRGVDSFVSVRKKPPYCYFSSSDESDDSLPVPPSASFGETDSPKISDDNSDIKVLYVETECVSQDINSDSSTKFVSYSSEICVTSNHVSKTTCSDSLDNLRSCDLDNVHDKKKMSKKIMNEEVRQKRKNEKEQRKLEQAREKALKKTISEAQKANQRGECLKHIRTLLDQRLLTEEYGGDILLCLQNSTMLYDIQEHLFPKAITWVKFLNDFHCDDDMKITTSTNIKEENVMIVIVTASELIDLVKEKKLRNYIKHISTLYCHKLIYLLIYKLQEYYRIQNLEKQRNFKAQCRGVTNKNKKSEEYKVSQRDIEKALIEVQILENCSHATVETPQELGSRIVHFTKALAEKDFKQEMRNKEQERLEWFAEGDSRDTIKVDKNGNGLVRLWKQQLCNFNSASLDTAEAIMSLYGSPASLMMAYENCSSADGQKLLQDIPVRRGAGPLTTSRRVGPELSKKIHCCFSALNGDFLLSQD